jgi:hypothetical protein
MNRWQVIDCTIAQLNYRKLIGRCRVGLKGQHSWEARNGGYRGVTGIKWLPQMAITEGS